MKFSAALFLASLASVDAFSSFKFGQSGSATATKTPVDVSKIKLINFALNEYPVLNISAFVTDFER